MNTSPFTPPPEADETASLWAARLDGGELEADARRELAAWLGQAPENRERLSRYGQLSADLERTLAPAIAPSARAPRRRWVFAALAVAAAVAVTFSLWRPTPAPQAVTTLTAAQRTVTLSDGTQVELNARTKLEFRHTGAERRVRLLEGEAFFSVSHDASRPFFVETAAGTVRVTGTKFSVRSESGAELEVIVAEGSVEMNAAAAAPGNEDRIMLAAGNRGFARAGQTGHERLTADALENALAWREGAIVLNGLTLQEALQRVGRYHDRRIEVTPAAAGKKDIAARMNLADLDGFLETIGGPDSTFGLRVSRSSDLIRVRLATEP
jgi:transmembrane sensor